MSGQHIVIRIASNCPDNMVGGDDGENMFAGGGNDRVYGGGGDDVLYGGSGNDSLYGGSDDDMLFGGAGDDTLTGGSGSDIFVFYEDTGDDTIVDFNPADGDRIELVRFSGTVSWDAIRDKISTVADPNDPDVVTGLKIDLSDFGGGTIVLNGLTSVSDLTEDMFILDRITGRDGADDVLQGGESDDSMTGGTGADTFVFDAGSGSDTITDFSTTEGDRIDLTAIEARLPWADLQAAMTQVGDDTMIDLTGFGGGTITLQGIDKDDLTEDMFVLDDLAGTDGDDILVGLGNHPGTLTGGEGADTFVLGNFHRPGELTGDKITDFAVGEDKLDLSAFTSVTSMDDLNCIQFGNSCYIVIGTYVVELEGVSAGELSASDFIFYQDEYTGTDSAETLEGGAGDDTITGLGGDDTLTGNEGADTFVFAADHGDDTVTDFTDGEDLIDLTAFTGITQFSDLTVTQDGSDVKIDLTDQTDGGSITLQNVLLADLDENDFVFYEMPSEGG